MITPEAELLKRIRNFEGITLWLTSHTSINLNEPDLNDDNATPLIVAAMVNNSNAAEILLTSGANPNLADNEGLTALHWAAHNNSVALIEKILSKGGDINAPDNTGSTPLHWAYNLNSMEAVKILKAKGANLFIEDKNGKTPPERSTAPKKTHEDQLQMSPPRSELLEKKLNSPSFRNIPKNPSGDIDLIELKDRMSKLTSGRGFNFNFGINEVGIPQGNLTLSDYSTLEK